MPHAFRSIAAQVRDSATLRRGRRNCTGWQWAGEPLLGTCRSLFLSTVAYGLQWKGGKGRAYCAGNLPESLLTNYPQADFSGLKC